MITEEIKKRIEKVYENISNLTPLVHNITNYVTVNDCANIQLAFGGSPIMADDENEVEEIVNYASALVLNIGTLNKRTIKSMVLAGKKANEKGIPVILDPVGGSFTALRIQAVEEILSNIKLAVVRGNFSEILGILDSSEKSKGVDAADNHENNTIEYKVNVAKKVANNLNCVVVITGATDIITSKDEVFLVKNGDAIMSKITGTGCMLTALLGVSCGAIKEDIFGGTIYAVLSMGIAGEVAKKYIDKHNCGTGTFRVKIIDTISLLNSKLLLKEAKISEGF